MIKHKRRWEWIRLKTDMAFYLYCNKCQFYYPAYKTKQDEDGYWHGAKPDPSKAFPYCPYCGKKMLKPVDNIHYKEYNIIDDTWEDKSL